MTYKMPPDDAKNVSDKREKSMQPFLSNLRLIDKQE